MGFLDCLRFSILDLKYKSKNTVRMALCFFLLQFIVIVWLLISIVLPRTQANYANKNTSIKYLVSRIDVNDSGVIKENSEGLALRDFLLDKGYIGTQNPTFGSINLIHYAGQDDRWRFINCDWLEMDVTDGKKAYTYSISDSDNLEFEAIVCGNQYFYSGSEYKRYITNYEDCYEGVMICGDSNLSEKDIVLPDKIMELFVNDKTQWSSLVGKNITIICNDTILIENYKLKGIYDYRLYCTDPAYLETDTHKMYLPVYLRCNDVDLVRYGVNCFDIVLYCNEEVNYGEVCNETRRSGFQNVAFSDDGILSEYSDTVINSANKIIKELVKSLGTVISIAILFYLATTVYIEKKNKSGYVGMLKAMGLENNKILLITCFQQLAVSILAIIPSCIFSGLVLLLINTILDSAVGIVLEATMADFLLSAAVGISSTVLAGILLYLPALISYAYQNAAKLMGEN